MSAPARTGDEPSALPPLRAALLVGGGSRRMGSPKQLLELDGETFAERIARAATEAGCELLVSGAGELPVALDRLERLPDALGVRGPIAALVSLLRHDRESAWLALAADQPRVNAAALRWLIGERRAGADAVLPRISEARLEPLPAIYEPTAFAALETIAAASGAERSLQRLPALARVAAPRVPDALAQAFAGANDPAELERLRGRGSVA